MSTGKDIYLDAEDRAWHSRLIINCIIQGLYTSAIQSTGLSFLPDHEEINAELESKHLGSLKQFDRENNAGWIKNKIRLYILQLFHSMLLYFIFDHTLQ